MLPLLLLAPAALGIASGGMSILGGLQAEEASNRQSDYINRVGQAQELALRRAAKAQEASRQQQAASVADAQIRRRASMEARYAKSGVTTAGSVGTVMAYQAAVDERNLQQMDVASFYAQRSLRVQALNAEREASNLSAAARAQGDAARLAGFAKGGAQIAGGIGGALTSGAFAPAAGGGGIAAENQGLNALFMQLAGGAS